MAKPPFSIFAGGNDPAALAVVHKKLQAAVERARREGCAIACLTVQLDRHEELHRRGGDTLCRRAFGVVLRVVHGLADERFAIGFSLERRLLLMMADPGLEADEVRSVARRIVDGSRDLEWDADGEPGRLSISIGAVWDARAAGTPSSVLVNRAAQRVQHAATLGGGRVFDRDPPAPEPPMDPRRRAALQQAEILARAMAELDRARAELDDARQNRDGEYLERIAMLERRVTKLLAALHDTEEKLVKVARSRSLDADGLASIYREVQGLAGDEKDFELKKKLMAAIFEANVELRRALTKGDAGG